MFSKQAFALLIAASGCVAVPQAGWPAWAQSMVTYSTSSYLSCSTTMGSSSVKSVRTSTSTTTQHPIPLIGMSVYAPVTTVTPAPITLTQTALTTTVTTTTASTLTGIYSTTSTFWNTLSFTVTPTNIATSTSVTTTTSIATTVMPTPASFLAIANTTASGSAQLGQNKRAVASASAGVQMNIGVMIGYHTSGAKLYPSTVKCIQNVAIITKIIYTATAKTATSTLLPSTTMKTVTATITSTLTRVPKATTTISFSTTITASTTTTLPAVNITTTASSTVIVSSTVSSWAACATDSNNYISQANGEDIVNIGFDNSLYTFTLVNATSQYDCCSQCQQDGSCLYSAFMASAENTNFCGLAVGASVCMQSQNAGYYNTSDITMGAGQVQLSNGNCGYAYLGTEVGGS